MINLQPTWQQLSDLPQRPLADSPETPPINFALIENYGVIRFTGEDASTFLQSQLTNDAAQVTPNQAQLSGYCNPKGRLIGLFQLIPSGDGYLAICHRTLVQALIKKLRMFVMRSSVTIEDLSDDWAIAGIWGSGTDDFLMGVGFPTPDSSLHIGTSEQHPTLAAVFTGFLQPAYRLLGPREQLAKLLYSESLARTEENEWNLLTINAGEPLLTDSTADAFIPQMINLDLINGVSFQKGCYPGQEIVARTRYLGKLKKRMFLFEMTGFEGKAGDPIYTPGEDQSVGNIVNLAVSAKDRSRVLAVMRLAALNGSLTTLEGQVLTQVTMPYRVPTTAENSD